MRRDRFLSYAQKDAVEEGNKVEVGSTLRFPSYQKGIKLRPLARDVKPARRRGVEQSGSSLGS